MRRRRTRGYLMIKMLPDNLLWKYKSLTDHDRNLLGFLEDCCFRITQPSALNDPFEMKPCVLVNSYSDDDWRVAREQSLHDHGQSLPDNDIEMLYLQVFPGHRFDEKNFPSLFPVKIPELRKEPFRTAAEYDEFCARSESARIEQALDKNIGVFSLSEEPTQLLMWAHYGAEHRGMAIGFDRQHAFFRTEGSLLQVEYCNERISVSSNGGLIRIAGHLLSEPENIPTATLLRKHPDWAYEKEWRFVVPLIKATTIEGLDSNRQMLHLLRFPETMIKALIFGARVDRDTKSAWIERVRTNERWKHLRLFSTRLSEINLSLEIDEVSTH